MKQVVERSDRRPSAHAARRSAAIGRLAFFRLAAAVVLLIASSMTLRAQRSSLRDSKFLRDYAETRGFNLGRPNAATPTPDGRHVLFLRARPRDAKQELYEFEVESGATRLLLSPEALLKGTQETLSAEEKALRERMRVSVGGFTEFHLSKDGRRVMVSLSGQLYILNRADGTVQPLKISAGSLVDPKFSPDGDQVAYVLDYDVYVYDLKRGQERRVTFGGTSEVSHGLAEFVAREEMLRYSGYWWSPDSRFIACEESDVRNVEIWYVADPAKPGQTPYPSHYPRPGKANARVRLGIVPVEGGPAVWVNWNRDRFPYLTTVVWDEDGPLTLAVQTRDQKEVVLLAAHAETGGTTALLTERDADWVDLRQDVPKWLPGNQGFLWAHEQAGSGWQLEWRRPDGGLERVLVPASFGFRSLLSVDRKNGLAAFTARPDPTQWKVYRVSLTGAHFVELTPSPGCHDARFDEHHSLYVDSVSALDGPRRSIVYRMDGTRLGELPSVAEEPPFLPKVELAKLGSEPGFYTAVVRPRDFSPGTRYPVLVHVYGGPLPPWSSGTVVASMSAWLLPQWIADQGFVLVSIDGRGTPGRGHDWERAIAKRFGSVPLEDQASGLKELGQRHSELDLARVGMFGWSFGGYMSALAVLKEPDLFKAAVAGAPPTDWLDYDTHYTERYLGIPPDANAAYDEGSLLLRAVNLRRPLLLIHGTGDDNVYFRHTLRLVDALFRAGRSCEVLPLSGLTHMVPDPVVNEQLYTRQIRFFKEHLGNPTPEK
jgi:dipeptidyl-peptidase-4